MKGEKLEAVGLRRVLMRKDEAAARELWKKLPRKEKDGLIDYLIDDAFFQSKNDDNTKRGRSAFDTNMAMIALALAIDKRRTTKYLKRMGREMRGGKIVRMQRPKR